MIALKPLITEFISNPIIQLKDYLTMSDEAKRDDLAEHNAYYIEKWTRETDIPPEIENSIAKGAMEPYEEVEALKERYRPLYDNFTQWLWDKMERGDLNEMPAWAVMTFENIVKNHWLIHFSDDAYEIWESQKFSYGLDDLYNIGYSTYFKKEAKKYGGYNFSYDIKDFSKYGRSSYRGGSWKYGKAAVVFRASGIRAYHSGDEEPQVVFWGETARNIVLIKESDPGPWGVVTRGTGRYAFIGELTDAVRWVVANFDQYRRVLIP